MSRFRRMKEVLTAMGVLIPTKAGYEADDILGTIAKRCAAEGGGFIVSEIVTCRSLQIRTLRFGCRVLRKVMTEMTITRRMKAEYQVTPIELM